MCLINLLDILQKFLIFFSPNAWLNQRQRLCWIPVPFLWVIYIFIRFNVTSTFPVRILCFFWKCSSFLSTCCVLETCQITLFKTMKFIKLKRDINYFIFSFISIQFPRFLLIFHSASLHGINVCKSYSVRRIRIFFSVIGMPMPNLNHNKTTKYYLQMKW